ncbi:MAG: right-handed parallel beta-helix repeat-containing protein, partial [Bacteroidales bacterium]|nr:right-handed parallel beta-helix repeat-containing protein [Bacteroidales bacterium]
MKKSILFIAFQVIVLILYCQNNQFHKYTKNIETAPQESLVPVAFVDDDFNSGTPGWGVYTFNNIQDGINAVEHGGTVNVNNGLYNEQITINKKLFLIGEDKNNTKIEGLQTDDVIKVNSDSVSITGFFISESEQYTFGTGIEIQSDYNYIHGNILSDNFEGLMIVSGDNNLITDNTLTNNNHSGIRLKQSTYNTISENSILDNYSDGIYIREGCEYNDIFNNEITDHNRYGILLRSSSKYNLISGNSIHLNTNDGISIGAVSYGYCSNNTITDNIISDNGGSGIAIDAYSNNNEVYENEIENNIDFGIKITNECGDNKLYHNNVNGNTQNAEDSGTNTWHDSYPSGGNYYDDYVGDDYYSGPNQNVPGFDGIGDTPYLIPGGSNVDQYPLYYPWGSPPPPPPQVMYVNLSYNQYTPGWGYDHFNQIQDAINALQNSGVIYVDIGIYFENLIINDSVLIIGEEKQLTIIDGNNTGNAITISAAGDHAGISGFTVRNSGDSSGDAGIEVFSDNVSIINNYIKYNGNNGINLNTASNCVVKENIIFNNQNYGLKIINNSVSNFIYQNDFINNGQNVWDGCTNIWDNGYPSGGNYWDDYTGDDIYSGPLQNIPGSDSIGDTPYTIQGAANQDGYPLMYAQGPFYITDTVYVDDDFTSSTPGWGTSCFDKIQDGVNAVDNFGIVNVYNGNYPENILIDKPLSLIGENRDSTVIDGGSAQFVIKSIVDLVDISGFTVINSDNTYVSGGLGIFSSRNTVSNNIFKNNYEGIYLTSGSNNKITNNIMTENAHAGIFIYNSDHNFISGDSIINNVYDGIYLRDGSEYNKITNNYISFNGRFGLSFRRNCSYNEILGNTINNNIQDGISMGAPDFEACRYNHISKNQIKENGTAGIDLRAESKYNTITYNTFQDNASFGVRFTEVSEQNYCYHNNFSGNSPNAIDYNSNTWDNSYPAGGNYWDDYSGTDIFSGPLQNLPGSDGIGDTPYSISGGNSNDTYPLMNPISPPDSVPNVVYIDDDYNSTTPGWGYDHFAQIQPAINSLEFGGSAYVYNGYYYDNVLILKKLSLIGQNKDSVFLDGQKSGHTVSIYYDSVLLTGFTIKNCATTSAHAGVAVFSSANKITDNIITENQRGIYIYNHISNDVINNTINKNGQSAIFMVSANKNRISENILYENAYDGIYLRASCSENLILTNNILFNERYGIILRENSQNNEIKGNYLSFNAKDGISFGDPNYKNCSSNIIDSNIITYNQECGIRLD